MISLLDLLPDAGRAGVYHSQVDATEIVAAAKTAGLLVFTLDLAKVRDKKSLLDLFAKTLKFPRHFGENWDALNDCLADLTWLDGKGWVLLLRKAEVFSHTDNEVFHTVLDVLESAAAYWREQGKPFWAFVEGNAGWESGLAKLTGE
jgi:RNAse (barnase) inhibitor barstar